MATTQVARRRARRILSAVLVALLAFGGGTALVLSSQQPAFAVNPLTNDVLENTPITHSPFLFFGTADPGDPITVDSGGFGPDCNTVADGLGNWTCNLILTASTDLTIITASRPDDGTPAQDSEGWEYPIALPVTVDESSPGEFATNNPLAPITGSGAWPTATMLVTVGGIPAACGAADGAGNWSCTPPALADGTYAIVAQQDVGGAQSDPTNSSYRLDTTTFIPRFAFPFDSTLPPAGIETSDTTPTVGGNAGDAEPFGTVTVYASDFGLAPPAHPNGGPFDVWCVTVADATGAWSCTGPALTVDHYWDFGVTQEDALGNVTGSPDDEFDIHILQPPDAPVVNYPSPGAQGISPFLADGTVDLVTTSVRIREGATDLCGVIIPVAGTWSCPGFALAPGPHTITFDAIDMYGTATSTNVNVESWAQPTITAPLNGSTTSASSVHVTGTTPAGSELDVRVDGGAACHFVPAPANYDCASGFLGVGPHAIDVDYVDPKGDLSATISHNITIVPTLPAPTFITPTFGYQSTERSVHVSMTNAPEGTVYVREGIFNLCPPTPVPVATFSCDTIPLSVGTHTITISQTDQYDVMSATAQRVVTILPNTDQVLMKTFGFTFQVLDEFGNPLGEDGLGTGDIFTIVASNVPPGTQVEAEIHSDPVKLGGMTIGQTGVLRMTSVVPPVPPGDHEIVIGATAPGYWPLSLAQPIAVHGLKQIPETTDDTDVVEDEDGKQLGTLEHQGTGTGGPGSVGAGGWGDPSVFGTALESPFDPEAHAFALSPAGIVLSGSIAIAFLLLVGFPAELLESTIRSNYDRAFGWLARLRRRVGRMLAPVARLLANPWAGSLVTILAASVILGFADPGFGFTATSVRLVLAMMVSVLAVNVGLSLIVMRVARRAFDVASALQPMPAALGLVALSVLVSRLAGISPGFLFGFVLGIVYARELKLRDDARLGVLGVGLTLAAGVLAWLGYGAATAAMSGEGFVNNLVIEVLAAITLEALGTLVVALLPIEFLDGRTIFRWSKVAWLGLYLITVLVFLFVVVPLSDNWGTMSAPILGWGTLFAVFAVVAVATWAIFRRRVSSSSPEGEARRPRARR